MIVAPPQKGAPKTPDERRQRLVSMRAGLDKEFEDYRAHMVELAEYLLPRRGHYLLTSDKSGKGGKKHSKIINPHGSYAMRTAAAGLSGGLTRPSDPWFEYSVPRLRGRPGALTERSREERVWLEQATEAVRSLFIRSNIYESFPKLWLDALNFGTSCMTMEPVYDPTPGIFTYVHPVGTYRVANGLDGRLTHFATTRQMTAYQIAERWGFEALPEHLRHQITASSGGDSAWQATVDVHQMIYPNDEHNPRRGEPRHRRWRQTFWHNDNARSPDDAGIIDESGFDYFPVIPARYERLGTAAYGDSLGMDILPTVKGLQKMEAKSLIALGKMVDPPTVAPSHLQAMGVNAQAGGVTWVDETEQVQQVRELSAVRYPVGDVQAKINITEAVIDRLTNVDLFRLLSTGERERTAFEVEQIVAERNGLLGPIFENFSNDTLDPTCETGLTLAAMLGELPPTPEGLAGETFRVEYTSIIARAMRLQRAQPLRATLEFFGAAGDLFPEMLDRINADELAEEALETLGAPMSVQRSLPEARRIRNARAQAAQQAEQLAAAQAAASAVRDASAANPENLAQIPAALGA